MNVLGAQPGNCLEESQCICILLSVMYKFILHLNILRYTLCNISCIYHSSPTSPNSLNSNQWRNLMYFAIKQREMSLIHLQGKIVMVNSWNPYIWDITQRGLFVKPLPHNHNKDKYAHTTARLSLIYFVVGRVVCTLYAQFCQLEDVPSRAKRGVAQAHLR